MPNLFRIITGIIDAITPLRCCYTKLKTLIYKYIIRILSTHLSRDGVHF